jgi:acetyl esterase
MPLDPQAQRVVDALAALNLKPIKDSTPTEARESMRTRTAALGPFEEVAAVADHRVPVTGGEITVRLYRPAGVGPHPVLVFYHGGGWTIGDLDTHDVLCRQLCNGSGAVVVSVDYRMGPEHRFPAAVDDCLAATRWVRHAARELGVDAARLAVGGDSAGSNLAAVVAILARDAGDLPIAYQLLIYPATDMRRRHPSHTTNGRGYLLTTETISYYHDHYIADPAHDLDWRASPLLHADLTKLPPALVLSAGFDPLRDEGLEYADRLVAAGNRATYVCYERQIHGFITMGKVVDEANTAVAFCAAELKRALAAA